MSEHADREDLSVEEAVSTIKEAQGYELPLRRRTEGVTWMIWGLVTAGIQLSFDALGEGARAAWPYWSILIIWPLVGAITTTAVWNIARVHAPELQTSRIRSVLVGLAWLPVVYGVWGLLALLGPGLQEAAFPLLAVGGAWLVLGATDLFGTTVLGRRVLLVTSGAILLAGLVVAYLAQGAAHEGWPLAGAAMLLVGGGAPFLGGTWQALRG